MVAYYCRTSNGFKASTYSYIFVSSQKALMNGIFYVACPFFEPLPSGRGFVGCFLPGAARKHSADR